MKLINIKQLSEMLSVKPKTIYDWIHKESIPFIKLGRLVRFDPKEIEPWVKRKRHRRSGNG